MGGARRPEKRRTGEDTFWRERGQKTRGGVGCPPPPNRGDRRGGLTTRSWREGRPRVQYDRREVSVLDYSRAKQGLNPSRRRGVARYARRVAGIQTRAHDATAKPVDESLGGHKQCRAARARMQNPRGHRKGAPGPALGSAERQDRALLTAAKLVARLLPERNHYFAAEERALRFSRAGREAWTNPSHPTTAAKSRCSATAERNHSRTTLLTLPRSPRPQTPARPWFPRSRRTPSKANTAARESSCAACARRRFPCPAR